MRPPSSFSLCRFLIHFCQSSRNRARGYEVPALHSQAIESILKLCVWFNNGDISVLVFCWPFQVCKKVPELKRHDSLLAESNVFEIPNTSDGHTVSMGEGGPGTFFFAWGEVCRGYDFAGSWMNVNSVFSVILKPEKLKWNCDTSVLESSHQSTGGILQRHQWWFFGWFE